MELRQLQTFIQAAQLQSFSKAAMQLGYSQSAVTVQIRMLEKELGTRLFDRMGKQVVLTAQGKKFLEHANRILYEVNRTRLSMHEDEELKNPLHIGTIESLCSAKFPSIVSRFRERYPQVKFQITVGTPEELIRMMEHDLLDLIYILDAPRWSENWVKAMEVAEPIVFVASPLFLGRHLAGQVSAQEQKLQGQPGTAGQPDTQGQPDTAGRPDTAGQSEMQGQPGMAGRTGMQEANWSTTLDSILREPFFLTEKNANYRQALDQYLASCHCALSPVLEISDTAFIIQMLEQSRGLSFLPLFAVQRQICEGTLAVVEVEHVQISMYRQIFYHKNKFKTREMEQFIVFASEEDARCADEKFTP